MIKQSKETPDVDHFFNIEPPLWVLVKQQVDLSIMSLKELEDYKDDLDELFYEEMKEKLLNKETK